MQQKILEGSLVRQAIFGGLNIGHGVPEQGSVLTLIAPIILQIRAPPPPKPIYQERATTLVVPLETVTESSAKLVGTIPITTMHGEESADHSRSKTWRRRKDFWNQATICDHVVN